MARRMNRRQMLATSAASLGYVYTAPAVSAARIQGANAKLRVCGIGVGGKGSSDIDQAGNLMEVVALCDVDSDYPRGQGQEVAFGQGVHRLPQDLRRQLAAQEHRRLHRVHSGPQPRAAQHPGDASRQARLLPEAADARRVRGAPDARPKRCEHGVCTQMGNQGTAANGLRRAVELVRAGVLGDVTEVHVWTNRPIWPQAPGVMKRSEPKIRSRSTWTGKRGSGRRRAAVLARADRPKNPKRGCYHDFAWRGWWDFGTGAIGDMACHTGNMAFMALRLGHPVKVSAEAGDVNDETCPSFVHATIEFPIREVFGKASDRVRPCGSPPRPCTGTRGRRTARS